MHGLLRLRALRARFNRALAIVLLSLGAGLAQAQDTLSDVPYAEAGGSPLLLDLYRPAGLERPAVVIWVHGGAWRFGSKDEPPILEIVDEGFALASIDFRNSPEAPFPGQLHDIHAAIRYLKANADSLGIDGERLALWGHSSGGHLAALAGLTADVEELTGELGQHRELDSSVQAIVAVSGPSNLATILRQSTPHGLNVREPAVAQLIGAALDDPAASELLARASSTSYVGPSSPPLLLRHGIQDNQVPINQSMELEAAYREAGRPVTVEWLPEAEHGSRELFEVQRVAEFLREHGLATP